MKLRRKHQSQPAERANPTRIAVLEHDLLGIQPEPGSHAALAIALRRTGTCIRHQPVEVTSFSDPRPVGLCTGCGANMVLNDTGHWELA